VSRHGASARVELAREADRAKAKRLVEKAEAACLVTRSLSAEVVVEPVIEVAPVEAVV